MGEILVMEDMAEKTNELGDIINPEKTGNLQQEQSIPKREDVITQLLQFKIIHETQDELFVGAEPTINEVLNAFGLKNKSYVLPNGDRYKDDFIFFKTDKC